MDTSSTLGAELLVLHLSSAPPHFNLDMSGGEMEDPLRRCSSRMRTRSHIHMSGKDPRRSMGSQIFHTNLAILQWCSCKSHTPPNGVQMCLTFSSLFVVYECTIAFSSFLFWCKRGESTVIVSAKDKYNALCDLKIKVILSATKSF